MFTGYHNGTVMACGAESPWRSHTCSAGSLLPARALAHLLSGHALWGPHPVTAMFTHSWPQCEQQSTMGMRHHRGQSCQVHSGPKSHSESHPGHLNTHLQNRPKWKTMPIPGAGKEMERKHRRKTLLMFQRHYCLSFIY